MATPPGVFRNRALAALALTALAVACGIKGPPRPMMTPADMPPSSAQVEQSPGRGPISRAPLPDSQPDAGLPLTR